MKRNLQYAQAAEQIRAQAQRLQPTSKAVWGTMTVTERRLHCIRCNEQIFQPAAPTKRPRQSSTAAR